MAFDLVGVFFNTSPVGPGYVLGLTATATTTGMRDIKTGEYRRGEHQLIWLCPLVFFAMLGVLIPRIVHKWGTPASIALLCQCLVGAICCVLTMNRLRALPVVHDKI